MCEIPVDMHVSAIGHPFESNPPGHRVSPSGQVIGQGALHLVPSMPMGLDMQESGIVQPSPGQSSSLLRSHLVGHVVATVQVEFTTGTE